MNPIVFALRHPIAVMVAMAAILVGSVLAVARMKVDVFPSLNLPVIYVCQPYSGMDPAQMEGLLTNYYEYHFLYINGIHHVESKNIQGLALMKLYFHPDTNMAQAMAETIQYVNRSRAFMPPGTVGPFVMRFDTGSVPVGYLVLSSDNPDRTIGEIQDQGLFKVRPMFASLPGVSAPPPFGGSARAVVIRTDPDRLRAYNVSPEEVIAALTTGNTVSPSGNIRVKDRMPLVPANAMVVQPQELGNIPIRPGADVYLRDLVPNGLILDSTDVTTGYAPVNGRRAVYILVTKRADASTTAVVNEVKANLPKMQAAIPDDIKVSFEFDQSPYVTSAVATVGVEGFLGALLTGLMVFLFLRDWRSVVVVVLNIPFALLSAVVALWLTGQTINLMTLGGLALAVGILVDEATVEIENIHTQFAKTGSIARAVRLGNSQTAVPRLLAMLCILAVFLPSFLMQGAAQALFVPLSLAVGFAMVASYLLSNTLVPVLAVWLLRRHQHEPTSGRRLDRWQSAYGAAVRLAVRLRWVLLPAYVVAAGGAVWLAGSLVGREIFPRIDAGQFQLRLKAPTGTRIERTEEITQKALDVIKEKVGADNVAITLGYVGVVPSSFPINGVYQWMTGPEEAVVRVALKRGSGVRTAELTEQLRTDLPRALEAWLRPKLAGEGFTAAEIEERVAGIKLSFEPADIVNTVMSFGSPTPVEVVVSGPSLDDNRAFAEKVRRELEQVDSLRDLQFAQPLDYPTVEVKIDRERTGRSGLTAENVARSLVAATSSRRFVVPNYWRDPKSGVGYHVQVEIPIERMNSPQEVGLLPLKNDNGGKLLLQDVAQVAEGKMPGEYDRYNMRRLVSLTANIHGEDLGRAAGRIAAAVAAAGAPPRGVQVDVRGQVEPMRQMFGGLGGGVPGPASLGSGADWLRFLREYFQGLTGGLMLAVVVILLLLTAYFQSLRLALVVVSSAPAVVAGVALALLLTGTTLNIQSFMGAIMAVGVATANAILLITFAERARRDGAAAADAAVEGAQGRVRPILMTSFAMIAGMAPMALGLGEGGQQVAPLGRAVIGGLTAATLATLFILPCVFAAVQSRGGAGSVSLDPDDPASPHYDGAPAPQDA